MKYNQEFKLKLIKHFEAENSSISQIALKKQIPKQTLARWIRLYRLFGERGLENNKPGVKETPVNADTDAQVLQLWKEMKRSKYRMRKDLKIKDINISEWELQKIYKKYKLIY
jgi:transposase-like protein